MDRPPILVVSGPTASGKTRLAIDLALALEGEVVSIDSVQIYREVDIGACKPSLAERKGVPHHLLDLRLPSEKFNVAEYREEAARAIDDIQSRGKLAIVAGGTTMYLTCLLHGLVPLPAADPALREALGQLSGDELYAQLSAKDPGAAKRLHPNDRKRVIRALEEAARGDLPSARIEDHAFGEACYRALILVLCPPREALYANINERSRALVRQGILEEARSLREKYGAAAPPLVTIGYSEAVAALNGRLLPDELEGTIAQSTRRLAKRQMTYWRNEPIKRGWKCVPSQARANPEVKAKAIEGRGISFSQLLTEVREELGKISGPNQVWYLAGIG